MFPSLHHCVFLTVLLRLFLEFPLVILNIEKIELGISAGLQDRVIQTYGGVVHMDFSPEATLASAGNPALGVDPVSPYRPLDAALLPDLYLAFDLHAGRCHLMIFFSF